MGILKLESSPHVAGCHSNESAEKSPYGNSKTNPIKSIELAPASGLKEACPEAAIGLFSQMISKASGDVSRSEKHGVAAPRVPWPEKGGLLKASSTVKRFCKRLRPVHPWCI